MNKRRKEEYIPRFNYITITSKRKGEAKVYDQNSNIEEYQTVIAVGDHVTDIEPGDTVKIEYSVFPTVEVNVDPEFETKIRDYSDKIQDKIDKINNMKVNRKTKDKLLQELQLEYTSEVQDMNRKAKISELPVYTDDYEEEFLWISDRAVQFIFKNK